MNLWAKRIGQLLITAALFFFSCDEPDLQGFKANQRFNVKYIEIPLNSSVFLYDSLVTANWLVSVSSQQYVDPQFAHLVGKYEDDIFGTVTSSIYAQVNHFGFPDSINYGSYDSISLQIAFNYSYLYGPAVANPQQLKIYELVDVLFPPDSTPLYINRTEMALKPTPVGEFNYTINPSDFDLYYKRYLAKEKKIFPTPADSANVVKRTLLDDEMGQRIFDIFYDFASKTSTGTAKEEDSVKVRPVSFPKEFKGLAIVPQNVDKMTALDFNSSKLVVHFNIDGKRDSIVFGFSETNYYVTNFNKIEADRTGSEVSEITSYYTDYFPSTDQRYIQNGVGITTKIEMDKFLSFVDTIPDMIINSAELLIENIPEESLTDSLQNPRNLVLRILKDDNTFYSGSNLVDIRTDYKNTVYPAFFSHKNLSIGVADERYTLTGDTRYGNFAFLPYNKTSNSYSTSLTLFLQQLFRNRHGIPLSNFALYSAPNNSVKGSYGPGKSVSRLSFNKDDVKLRIYYTLPTIVKID